MQEVWEPSSSRNHSQTRLRTSFTYGWRGGRGILTIETPLHSLEEKISQTKAAHISKKASSLGQQPMGRAGMPKPMLKSVLLGCHSTRHGWMKLAHCHQALITLPN